MRNTKEFVFKHYKLLLGLLAILLLISPILILGDQASVQDHDQLDSDVILTSFLAKNGCLFELNPNTKIPKMMSGVLTRSMFNTPFFIVSWLFIIFSAFTAFKINFLIVSIIAFLGMLVLLKRINNSDHAIHYIVAIIFATYIKHTMYGLTVAGLPLVIYAFLNLFESKQLKLSYGILIMFVFYSHFVLSGVFIVASSLLIYGYYLIVKKQHHKHFLIGIGLFTLVSILVNYQLFYLRFVDDFIGHRANWNSNLVDFTGVLNLAKNFFFNLQDHISYSCSFIIFITLIAFITSRNDKKTNNLLTNFLIANVVLAFIYGFQKWDLLAGVREKFDLLNSFQWNRFYIFSPIIWFLSFSVALQYLAKNYSNKIAIIILVIQGAYSYSENFELSRNFQNLYAAEPVGYSMESYFSEEIFTDIKNHIGKRQNSYRVASLGLEPGIALYNGFHTIDGYNATYPYSYKKTIEKICENEFKRNRKVEKYFVNWGNRCYIFPAELNKQTELGTTTKSKHKEKVINKLDLNIEELKKLNCQYLISTSKIKNLNNNKLELEKYFENERSYWGLYLYKVKK